jgi:hypothetical protein
MGYYYKGRTASALLMWGMSLWFTLTGAFVGCAAKMPPGYEAGYRAGFEDCDSTRFEHGDPLRLAEDLDYLRGYRDGMAEREREKVEKRDGLWGRLTGKW